ncbi:hypothetical protein FACS1894219_03560 [Clostridia bacterium]|nr:hypothetical protein FACS1894219_03560 [Clostridia bacterium]
MKGVFTIDEKVKNDLESVKDSILSLIPVNAIYLFGSYAKDTARENSDFDICIISETEHKRELITELYCGIEADKPIDILLYTPSEWGVISKIQQVSLIK